MGLTPATTAPTPPSSSLPPLPHAPWGKLQSVHISTDFFFPFPPCFFASPLHYQRTGDRLSEMFLLIPISFIITSFHVSGWLGPGGEGSGNYFGVLGINPTRCHWMACLPQWLMNGLLVSHCPPLTALFIQRGACHWINLLSSAGLSHITSLRAAGPSGAFSSYQASSSASGAKLISVSWMAIQAVRVAEITFVYSSLLHWHMTYWFFLIGMTTFRVC